MTDKEKIREYVKKISKINRERSSIEGYAAVTELRKVLAYIDSLPEEPVSEDLEEAAENHALQCHSKKASVCTLAASIYDFRAGANWKEQQMMKSAIEAKLSFGQPVLLSHPVNPQIAKDGDRVKVIIIKEDKV